MLINNYANSLHYHQKKKKGFITDFQVVSNENDCENRAPSTFLRFTYSIEKSINFTLIFVVPCSEGKKTYQK